VAFSILRLRLATSLSSTSMNYYDSINPNLELTFVSNLTRNHDLIFQSQSIQPTSDIGDKGYSISPPQSNNNYLKQKKEYLKERLSIFPHTTTLCHSSFGEKMMEIQSCSVAPRLLSCFLSCFLQRPTYTTNSQVIC